MVGNTWLSCGVGLRCGELEQLAWSVEPDCIDVPMSKLLERILGKDSQDHQNWPQHVEDWQRLESCVRKGATLGLYGYMLRRLTSGEATQQEAAKCSRRKMLQVSHRSEKLVNSLSFDTPTANAYQTATIDN